jgi:selenocysteine-specific elongation factor
VIAPGEAAMAQFTLDREIATQASERFLIRSFSPVQTIGGGRILTVNASRHRRFDQAVTERLETMATGNVGLIVPELLDQAGAHGMDVDQLAAELSVSTDEVEKAIAAVKALRISENRWVSASAFESLSNEIVATITTFHRQQPFRNGIDLGSLTGQLESGASPEVTRYAVKHLVDTNKLRNVNEVLSIAGYDPFANLGEHERKLAAKIEQLLLRSGIEWLSPEEVAGSDAAKRAVFQLLLETGRLVRLRTLDRTSEMIVHATAVANARHAIAEAYPVPQSFALKDIRDLLGSTRKYIVPFMEHLDATGATVRHGDLRRLRE